MQVAIIKIGALGDVVRTTSILPGLRRRFPDMSLTWISSTGGLDLVCRHPDVHQAVNIADPPDAQWRTASYDWLISLDDERITCQLASAIHATKISGAFMASEGVRRYTPDTEPWFGMGLLRPPDQGGIDRANQLKQSNTLSHGTIFYQMLALPGPVARPRVVLPEEDKQWARGWFDASVLSDRAKVIGINSGASGRWEFKKWGEDQTAALAASAHDEMSAGVLLLGGESELERNQRIAKLSNRPGILVAPHDLPLLKFSALVARCNVLLTSDSLALHLGLAADVPVVAFFGPTSSAEIDVYGKGEKVVTPLGCRCCYLPTCNIRPHCMASIGVERMYEAVKRWVV